MSKINNNARIRKQEVERANKAFEKRYQYLIDDVTKYKNLYNKQLNTIVSLKKDKEDLSYKIDELTEQVNSLTNWFERLQSFFDMSTDEAEIAYKTYIDNQKCSEELNKLFSTYNEIINQIFI